MVDIATVGGDGIGPEVVAGAVRVLKSAASAFGFTLTLEDFDFGADRFLRDGTGLSEDFLRHAPSDFDGILFGAVGDPRIPDMRHGKEILLRMRKDWQLYANFRPARCLDSEDSPLRPALASKIDWMIVRENTESLYAGVETSTDEGVIAQDKHSEKAITSMLAQAFNWAAQEGRERITLVDKANAQPAVGALWAQCFERASKIHPGLACDHRFVDLVALLMPQNPSAFDVIVTSNPFGDILSDLAAGLSGGPGLMPSASFGEARAGLFEPVHGSAPDLVGKNAANPIAAILSAAMLLRHSGELDAAEAIEWATRSTWKSGKKTPDGGGVTKCDELSELIASEVLARAE